MAMQELASVDGAIAPTAETTIPLRDDGLYRGDGVFEVIRLYGGRPFALAEHLDRLERSAAAIELPVDRGPLEREIEALLERNGDADAQLRLLVTRGGRRIALIEALVDWGETVSLATVTYSPTVILTGVKSLSYGANMQATRIAKAAAPTRRCSCAPTGSCSRRRPRRSSGSPRAASCAPRRSRRGSSTRSPAGRSSPSSRSPRASSARRRARGERGLPRLDHPRGPAGLGDRRAQLRGRPTHRGGAADVRPRGRRSARGGGEPMTGPH